MGKVVIGKTGSNPSKTWKNNTSIIYYYVIDKKPYRQRNLADNTDVRKTTGLRRNVERIRCTIIMYGK